MHLGTRALLLLSLGSGGSLAAQAEVEWRHRLVVTGSTAQRSEFGAKLKACEPSGVLDELLRSLAGRELLPVTLHTGSEDVLFATVGVDAPALDLDLADFRLLPMPEQVRGWPPDSSWAVTYCEVLLHEVGEALEYHRRFLAAATGSETGIDQQVQQRDDKRAAHAFAIDVERRVAAAHRTRLDAEGNPYMRTESCNDPELGLSHVRIGPHTQTFLRGNARSPVLEYRPNVDRCAEAGLPVRPNVPKASK